MWKEASYKAWEKIEMDDLGGLTTGYKVYWEGLSGSKQIIYYLAMDQYL